MNKWCKVQHIYMSKMMYTVGVEVCINCKVKSAYIRYLILLSILYWHWCLDMIIYLSRCARVAELADAHGSGPCESDFMGVQVPPLAPKRRNPIRLESGFFFLVYPSTRRKWSTWISKWEYIWKTNDDYSIVIIAIQDAFYR